MMKKKLFMLIVLLLAARSFSQLFTNPPFTSRTQADIQIKSIVNTDIYTEINFVYNNSTSSGHYIFLNPPGHADAFYITANGKNHRLIKTDKISSKENETVAMPGVPVEFSARFQKLPANTPTFDLIEGKNGTWHFYGVKLESGEEAKEVTKFRRDFNSLAVYNVENKVWGEWLTGDNTFVVNVNENGDIAHYKPSGESVIYKKVSGVEKGKSETGLEYQLIKALDEDGDVFIFQLYDDEEEGLRIVYSDIIVQFANIED